MSFLKSISNQEPNKEPNKVETISISRSYNRNYSNRLTIKLGIILAIYLAVLLLLTSFGDKGVFEIFEGWVKILTQPIHQVFKYISKPPTGNWGVDGVEATKEATFKWGALFFCYVSPFLLLFLILRTAQVRRKGEGLENRYIPFFNNNVKNKSINEYNSVEERRRDLIITTLNQLYTSKNIHSFLKEYPTGLFKKFRMGRRQKNFSTINISLELEKYYNRVYYLQETQALKKETTNVETKTSIQ